MLQHQQVTNSDESESRSSSSGGEPPLPSGAQTTPPVGGRPGSSGTPPGGGGYQNICSSSDGAVPAGGVDKLRRIGLARIWIEVAQKIGFDAFLRVWRLMDSHASLDVNRRIVVPMFRTSNPLAQIWVDISREVGMNVFVRLWRSMEGHASLDKRGRVVVPVYRAYERFERNEYIRALIAAGLTDQYIMAEVKRTFGDVLSRRSLLRLRSPRKITP